MLYGYERCLEIGFPYQRLQDSVGRHDEIEVSRVSEWQRTDVTAEPRDAILQARASGALSRMIEHFGGAIDPDDARTRARNGNRDAPCAAPELEDGASGAQRHALPEAHVPPV